MNNKQKTKMARRMRTPKEIKEGVPIFQTDAWEKRKEAKRRKVELKAKTK